MNKERWIFFGCLMLAGFFWLMQKLGKTYTIRQRYAVTYALPDGKVFRRQPANDILVTLQGKGWDILAKSAKNIGDKIEVELGQDNNQVIPSSAIADKINSILGSNEISVSRIIPSEIQIQLERQATKKVPIESHMNISYLKGYYQADPMVFVPDSVILTGAPELLRKLHSWPTKEVQISNLHKSITDMPVVLELPEEDMLRLNTAKVRVNLAVEEYTEKSFIVPLTVKNADSKVRILPDQVTVKCIVGLSKYDNLSADDLELYLNLDESLLRKGVNVAPVAISRMPIFVRNINFYPKAAEFFYVK